MREVMGELGVAIVYLVLGAGFIGIVSLFISQISSGAV